MGRDGEGWGSLLLYSHRGNMASATKSLGGELANIIRSLEVEASATIIADGNGIGNKTGNKNIIPNRSREEARRPRIEVFAVSRDSRVEPVETSRRPRWSRGVGVMDIGDKSWRSR